MQDVLTANDVQQPAIVSITDQSGDGPPKELPVTEREDGSLVIDLKPLGPVPVEQQCLERDPDPLDNTILVCRRTETDQRLGARIGPAEEEVFGSAVSRARVRISDNAEGQANVIKKGVGGVDSDGAEVRVKIDF